jgi:DNA-binding beta-propeller fold protein YncE
MNRWIPATRILAIALLTVATGWMATAWARSPAKARSAPAHASLVQAARIELPGYTGDFDHFAVDLKGDRLFLAAEDHDTLEVFDLKTGRHLKTISGVKTPHGLLYLPDTNQLIVTQTGGDGLTKVVDGSSYAVVGSIKHRPGADSMAYDAPRKRLYVVAGGRDMKLPDSYLIELDPYTGKVHGEVRFATDKVEAMAIEEHGDKIYINLTGKKQMAVLDKKAQAVIATWPITGAGKNAPLAFDEPNHRLFVVTRDPGRLIVVNADTGAKIADFKAPERCDQVIFDAEDHRVYVLGGEGYIGVFEEEDADHYVELARVVSAPGAKTGILVPELHKLFVAASPGDSGAMAALLVFDVARNLSGGS